MRSIAKVGAALVTAVALLATSAWAEPGNGNSEQWTYYSVDAAGVLPLPPLGDEVITVQGTMTYRVNVHAKPDGTVTGYVWQFVPEEGAVVITRPGGRTYVLRDALGLTESARGPWAVGGYWGTTTIHFIFEAANGDRLIFQGVGHWELSPNPVPGDPFPWVYTKNTYEWTVKER